jgi:hypothetical protein
LTICAYLIQPSVICISVATASRTKHACFSAGYRTLKYDGKETIKNQSFQLNIRHDIYLSIYCSTALFLGFGCIFSFLIFTRSVGLLGRGISPSKCRCLHIKTTQTRNKRTRRSMPQVGFELKIPVFGRAKTVHALVRAATLIGIRNDNSLQTHPSNYLL